MSTATRRLIDAPPFGHLDADRAIWNRGEWPARWVRCPGADRPPFVTAFRRTFRLDAAATITVHVSADERYELFLDGQRIGRGPERGDRHNWYFETFDLNLPAGPHTLAARCWALGEQSPLAQVSCAPGFILAADEPHGDLLNTGQAAWQAKVLGGYRFLNPAPADFTGWNVELDAAAADPAWLTPASTGWHDVLVGPPGQSQGPTGLSPNGQLTPATLPPMLERPVATGTVRFVGTELSTREAPVPVQMADHLATEVDGWQKLLAGKASLTIPPRTARRVIVDLDNYYCAYPQVVTSGGAGAELSVRWAEALFGQQAAMDISIAWAKPVSKADRNGIADRWFVGVGDTFKPDGGAKRLFEPLWWQAGRYVEISVQTADQPLTLDRFTLLETRYPLEMTSRFACSEPRVAEFIPIGVRALQMCSHETYMDCPYYEQLMYVGDTRLEALVTFVLTADARLPAKAVHLFDQSRLPNGLTQSRYPCRVQQIIPTFSLWWVGLVHDYALWRGDADMVRRLRPGVHAVLDGVGRWANRGGLIEAPAGWNFVDWAAGWEAGMAPEADRGVSSIVNLQTVLALTQASEMEVLLKKPHSATRFDRVADSLFQRVLDVFWDEGRGLLADDPEHKHFSEHAQCLALLCDRLAPDRRQRLADALVADRRLTRTTIYFSHYLFEALRVLGRGDLIVKRLDDWLALKGQGFKTTPEAPEPSRSDCHAWGAHPLFHFFATILGIRPAGLGFERVRVAPLLGALTWANGALPHPRGEIVAELKRDGDRVGGLIRLPEGVSGTWEANGTTAPLRPGENRV